MATQFMPEAQAVGNATGFATQNGGTTGGAGGATVKATSGTQIHQALCSRASSSTPITIQVEGTINHGNTSDVDGNSCNTTSGVIELRDISNVTILGVGGGAVFDQIGIHIREAENIIIQNVTVRNVKKSGSPTSNGGDAIGMESNVSNVWVDHVDLIASGGESEGYDGLFDMKAGTKYVTLSYSTLSNSGRGGLVGSGDSDTSNGPITFHHNLYRNIDSRAPLLRAATAHTYNNHFNGINESGINSRLGAKVKVENNYFQNALNPLGTFYTDARGYWEVSGNIWDNVTWGTEDYPAGPNPTSTTTVSIPYSYSMDRAECIPALLAKTAGSHTNLAVSDGSCSPTQPTATPTSNPTTSPTSNPTTSPTPDPTPTGGTPSGTNLSIGAGADGSSKLDGTSYGNVIDGNMSTYWSPTGTTGRISVKWSSAKTVGAISIREAAGASGRIGSWKVVNYGTGATLASGSGAGVITFTPVSLSKISFDVVSASSTPRIAEFETYASATGGGNPTPTPTPTSDPTTSPTPTTEPTAPAADALYVAPGGSDGAAGTISAPTTLASAVSRITPGGTIYLRGGTYNLSSTVDITRDGLSGNRTELHAYGSEKPVLNFSAQALSTSNRGLAIGADWWHLKGITVERAGDNGILLGGSNNIVERVVTRYNRDSGLQLSRYTAGAPSSEWPANNLVVSSVSHDNADPDGEDADGFAPKLTVGSGNVFRNTVSHNNIDDGWDLYTKSDTGPIGVVTIEDSLAFENGTLSNGGQAGAGDRNGYKLGGEGIKVNHVVRRSIAFDNGKHGFTYNSNPGSITVASNLSIGSSERNFQFDAGSHVFSNNTSCNGGSSDRTVGSDAGGNQWFSGSNGSRCSQYSGSLAWSFDASGKLVVTIGGTTVNLS
ncbi:hypothetical protein [Myceligenerans crystallogenes]|uniref:pectate lyase family protein n=1 Tax=Myceligenerans crystallogenes TaxID=316335 RepID=UPI0031D95E3D